MQMALNPSNLKLHKNGQLFTFPETLQIIKSGAKIPSNTRFDPAFTESFDKFPDDVKKALHREPVRLSTLVARPSRQSGALGEEFVFDDGTICVKLIVGKAFQKEPGLGIDLAKDNFEFETKGITTTIHLTKEGDVKALYLACDHCLREANERTLYLPLDENAVHRNGVVVWVWRSFDSEANDGFLALAARKPGRVTAVQQDARKPGIVTAIQHESGDIFINMPSKRLPLVEEMDSAA